MQSDEKLEDKTDKAHHQMLHAVDRVMAIGLITGAIFAQPYLMAEEVDIKMVLASLAAGPTVTYVATRIGVSVVDYLVKEK